MTRHIYIVFTVIFTACGTPPGKSGTEAKAGKTDTSASLPAAVSTGDSMAEDMTEPDNAIFFIVVADTNPDYYFLHQKMIALNQQLNIPIDTIGRFYNQTKNLIALPDNDEDEMYAGSYFPRRFPSENLSLEYLDYYQKQAREETIALVTGIYETETGADSALTVLKKVEEKAFKIEANIYLGCMH